MREVYLPAYSVGDDAIASSGSAFRRLGQNGIIIGGHHALDAAGESLRDALKKADVHVADTVWYGGECTYAHMRRLAERAKACGADMVIGVQVAWRISRMASLFWLSTGSSINMRWN